MRNSTVTLTVVVTAAFAAGVLLSPLAHHAVSIPKQPPDDTVFVS